MAVLVVGGSGFLGKEVARQLLAAGHQVAATYLTRPTDMAGAAWHAVDIRGRQQVADLVTAIKAISPTAVIARTSLIIGDGDSPHERRVHALAKGQITEVLFTDDVRCPVHVADLAAALLELASSDHAGIHHIAGTDAVSRHELGTLIAHRDGLDTAALPAGRRADINLPGPVDVRLDCTITQQRLRTTLRGARQFLNRHTVNTVEKERTFVNP